MMVMNEYGSYDNDNDYIDDDSYDNGDDNNGAHQCHMMMMTMMAMMTMMTMMMINMMTMNINSETCEENTRNPELNHWIIML